MSGPLEPSTREVSETVEELRRRLGLFSFDEGEAREEPAAKVVRGLEIAVGPGTIVEWMATTPGAGALTSALRMIARQVDGRGAWVVIDPSGEIYVPGLSGWGIDPRRTLLLRPKTVPETCWAIEQCLRCPGVAATWAWVEKRLSTTVLRRWKLAAEAGGGVGLLFRPDSARREPAWADWRLRVTPLSGGQGEARRIRIDVLYRRGGLGGSAQVWEIDHAAGDVRLVPEVAHPAAAERAARA